MRAFINIIILILLSLSLYVIPLNTNAFDFDTSNIIDDESSINNSKYNCIFTKVTEGDFLYNPKTYQVKIDSNVDLPSDLNKKVNYTIEFVDYNKNKTTFKDNDLGEVIFDQEAQTFNFIVDLTKAKEKLAYATYVVNIRLNCFDDFYEDSFKLFFEKDKIVLQNNTAQQQNNLQALYYSDKSLNYSIPVYRPKLVFANIFADLIYSLNNKPEEIKKLGLLAPELDLYYIPNMWFQNGKLRCGFYQSNLKNIKNQKQAELFIKNLNNSFRELPSYYIINELEFYLLDSDKKEISGYSIDKPFKIDRNSKVYLPIFLQEMAKDKYLWLDVDIETGEKIEDDVLKMFEAYKASPVYMKDKQFVALIPNIEVHKKITIVDDKLIIDLSDEMYEFLNNNSDYAAMLKEGLALSFSSIDGIKGYELWYENSLIEEINDLAFGANITAPQAYNTID